jgi:hypothetical protein
MSQLSDREIDRLSYLFASGHTGHAREIARLLSQELPERNAEPDLVFEILEQIFGPGMLGSAAATAN